MPSYHVKNVIKGTVQKVAVASVPTAFTPGIDTAVVAGFWTYMINEIADEHCVTIKDDTAKFAGVLASGIGAYWVGTTIINKILAAIIGVIIPIYGFFIAAPVLNVFLNGYFTWSVGKKADAIFSDYSNEKAGAEIATLIIKAVCHIPDASEIRDFLNEGGLTIKEIRNMLD